MSISYSSIALFGFKADISEVEKQVTKYNEDDGTPYAKRVFSHYDLYLEDVLFKSGLQNYDISYQNLGLGIYTSGYEDGQHFLGTYVAKCTERTDFCKFSEIDIEKMKTIDKISKQIGVKPSFYLLLIAS